MKNKEREREQERIGGAFNPYMRKTWEASLSRRRVSPLLPVHCMEKRQQEDPSIVSSDLLPEERDMVQSCGVYDKGKEEEALHR